MTMTLRGDASGPGDDATDHAVGASARAPRLELVFGVAAAGCALSAATMRLAAGEDDVRLDAALVAAAGALPLGLLARRCAEPVTSEFVRFAWQPRWLLRRADASSGLRERVDPRAWAALVLTWLAAATILGGALGYAMNFGRAMLAQSVAASAAVGLACGLVTLPGPVWLVHQARAARRARRGSIVAAADARAIWSVLCALLALASLAPLAEVGQAGRGSGALAPCTVFVAAAAALSAALVVLDLRAARRLRRLANDAAALEALDADTAVGRRVADVGLGAERVLGRVLPGGSYRHGGDRIPVLRGEPEEALRVLRAGVVWGVFRLLLVIAMLAGHALASAA